MIRDQATRPSIENAKSDLNYDFVDTLRFWSILAVVAIHCIADTTAPGSAGSSLAQALLTQAGKYATIAFFVCSGLLMGNRVGTVRNAAQYFANRCRNIALPWALWVSVLVLLRTLKFYPRHSLTEIKTHLQFVCEDVALHTSYWFVPNLLLCIAIILIFRKHLEAWWLGAILLGLNLIYVVNIYQGWFETDHSSALFAFVFYLWLGAFVVKRLEWVKEKLASVSKATIGTLIALFAALSLGEAKVLHEKMPLLNSLNTLRVTNQLFSLCVVAYCIRLKGRHWPPFMDVRKVTFGIYLLHPIFLAIAQNTLLISGMAHQLPDSEVVIDHSVGFLVGTWAAVFLFVYGCSYLTSNWLAQSKMLGWTVGQRSSRQRRNVMEMSQQTA